MNELFIGSAEDRAYVSTYLENIRSVDPIEVATLPNPISLADTEKMGSVIDVGLFWEIVSACEALATERYGFSVTRIAAERYYTASPKKAESIGGFHSPRSLGYQYWMHASFVVTLNPSLVMSEAVRTIELARSYLHDCVHHSTFRSYRRALRVPAPSRRAAKDRIPEVYRSQYGISFRNRDGIPYSARELTDRSPEAINLNLLMDGVTVIAVGHMLGQALAGEQGLVEPATLDASLDREVLNEVLLRPFDASRLPQARKFADSVTDPSAKFIARWGGEPFMAIALHAMASGNLDELRQVFVRETGNPNAWEEIFRRADYMPDEG